MLGVFLMKVGLQPDTGVVDRESPGSSGITGVAGGDPRG